jgi:hypothetical protein
LLPTYLYNLYPSKVYIKQNFIISIFLNDFLYRVYYNGKSYIRDDNTERIKENNSVHEYNCYEE